MSILWAIGGSEAKAANITWTGSDLGAFASGGNWSSTPSTPQTNDSLTFGGTGGRLNNNLTGPNFNISGITFSAGAGAFVIGDCSTNENAGNASR